MILKVSFPKAFTRWSDDTGTVLVEFASTFGFLVFLCFGAISLGNVLNNYLRVVQIADDAVRTLSSVPGLADGEEIVWQDLTPHQIENCTPGGVGGAACGHILSHARVLLMCRTLGIDVSNLNIMSVYREGRDSVFVRISLENVGILSLLGDLPITVEAEAPYLF